MSEGREYKLKAEVCNLFEVKIVYPITGHTCKVFQFRLVFFFYTFIVFDIYFDMYVHEVGALLASASVSH